MILEFLFTSLKNCNIATHCPGGGIGRRSRLKICRSQGCAGSIPVPGTCIKPDSLKVSGFFINFKIHT